MACASLKDMLSNVSRKKHLGSNADLYETPLLRSLTTFQLVLMGTGTMIGAGLYVLTGVVAKETTGPAIIVSYALAAIASLLSALCYVEFACRVPRTGSAYVFTYIAVGEIWAFLIGWNLILEYSIAAASVASSFTGYVDFLSGYALSNFTINSLMGGKVWDVSYIGPYPDIFSALLVMLITIFVITGAKVSSWINGIFICVNMVIILLITGIGFNKADIRNWQNYGGFVPNGAGSVIAGAATLFFSYVGFDTIAIANEETIDPKKSIPRATFISLAIAALSYILCSAALTLMIPYTDLDELSAFADAFTVLGIDWAAWVVGIGALCAMFTTVLMNLYCLPRSIYAMASDGLLFSWLGHVSKLTNVPTYATLCSMVLVAVLTLFFSLSQLVEFLSIGVLLGYTFVSCAVIILRYQPDNLITDNGKADIELESPPSQQEDLPVHEAGGSQGTAYNDEDTLVAISDDYPGTLKQWFRSVPLLQRLSKLKPGRAVNIYLGVSIFFQFFAILMMEFAWERLISADWWAILLLIILILGALLTFLVIPLHNQNRASGDYYRVRCVPLVPGLSILCNVTLVLKLNPISWLRFLVWVIVGLLIYIFYGYRHSKAGRACRERLNGGHSTTDEHFGSGASYGTTQGQYTAMP